jgi:hypothetical protein
MGACTFISLFLCDHAKFYNIFEGLVTQIYYTFLLARWRQDLNKSLDFLPFTIRSYPAWYVTRPSVTDFRVFTLSPNVSIGIYCFMVPGTENR